MLLKLIAQTTSLQYRSLYRYDQLPSELYFLNQRDTYASNVPKSLTLKPLKGANQGYLMSGESSDQVYLTGVPYGEVNQKFQDYDIFSRLNARHHPDLIFLQVDPSPYIARQRFLAHKCALQEVEGYDIHDCPQIDPLKPHSWEETVVNLVVLDMLIHNKNFDEIDWTKGLSTYSYPNIQSKEIMEQNTKLFIETVDEHIVNHKYSQFPIINKILYTALMGKHKVMLGDMPEHLYKINIGNTLEIGEARDIFKYTLSKVKELKVPISLRKGAYDFLPHIFQTPKDLYMAALLKEAFQAAETVNAYVGMPHITPIKHYWADPPHGINYSEATRIPPKRPGETDENLIEKQAMLDVLLETHTWAEPYLSNPFPYVVNDITQATAGDLQAMKECFFMYYQKYSAFKNELQKELPNLKDDWDIRFLEQKAPDVKYENSIEVKALKDRQLKMRNIQLIQ